jgi:hypothetical protein
MLLTRSNQSLDVQTRSWIENAVAVRTRAGHAHYPLSVLHDSMQGPREPQ